MKRFYKNIHLVGNIGKPIFNIIDQLNNKNEEIYLIAELSSFQLSDEINFPVDSGVILNISNDHLDWHKNFKDYIMAKINIFNEAKKKIAHFSCKEQIKKYISYDDIKYFGAHEKKEGF